jgi:hypothetical protein
VHVSAHLDETVSFVLFCVFGMMSLVVGVGITGVVFDCFFKYFQLREVFLKSIVLPKQRMNLEVEGKSSSSSDDTKIY